MCEGIRDVGFTAIKRDQEVLPECVMSVAGQVREAGAGSSGVTDEPT